MFCMQESVGKGGKIFHTLRFRSMISDAQREGTAVWAERGDTPGDLCGAILAGSHTDELAWFINIFRGEMSVAAARPERPEFVAKLEKIPLSRSPRRTGTDGRLGIGELWLW